MLSIGCNYNKLKTNLGLAINRLKLLQIKKTELIQKSRMEIADYLANGKIELSKIRVEHVIREDYLVEAMEVIRMFCDLLLTRFGLVQQMKTLDEGLAEAISSLIWAAPRLQTDVAELKIIADQLAIKYGRKFALAARENALNSINETLVHKLSVQTPPKILVEKYLIEIAKSQHVLYEPESEILADEAISNVPLIELDDTKPPEPGFVAGFPSTDKSMYPGIQYPQLDLNKPFNYPAPNKSSKSGEVPPPVSAIQPSGAYQAAPSYESGFGINPSASSATNTASMPNVAPVTPTPAPRTKFPMDTLLELPSLRNTAVSDLSDPNDGNNEVDFDDLAKRFKELKTRK